MLVNPEQTLFVRGTTPVLLLADPPVHAELPAVSAPDGTVATVARCEGWSIVPRLTLCVVDGPGEAGLMVPAMVAPVVGSPAGPGRMADWCADAERAGGAVVLSVDALPDSLDWPALLGPGSSRGGFVPLLG